MCVSVCVCDGWADMEACLLCMCIISTTNSRSSPLHTKVHCSQVLPVGSLSSLFFSPCLAPSLVLSTVTTNTQLPLTQATSHLPTSLYWNSDPSLTSSNRCVRLL